MKSPEEGHVLLEEYDLSESADETELAARSEETPPVRHRRSWRKRRSLVLGLLLTAAIVSLILGYLRWSRSDSSRDDEAQLAIALNPKEYSTRGSATLRFEWNVTSALRAPDGVEKRVYLVNGEFPGPTIEARSGDRIVVRVHNGLEDEGLSIHWHGLQMRGQNSMDGAIGVTQCPVPTGDEMVYDFVIGDDEFGTFWWHSHSGVQRADGLFGGLIVHSPTEETERPDSDQLIMVGDWFHQSQKDVLARYSHFSSMGREPVPDSLLINGRGRYKCSLAEPSRPVKCSEIGPGELAPVIKHRGGLSRFRIVNTGTVAGVTVKFDGAIIRGVRVDGAFPVKADGRDTIGIVYPGERVDFILELEQLSDNSAFTVQIDDENFNHRDLPLERTQIFPLFPGAQVQNSLPSGNSLSENNVLGLETLTSTTVDTTPEIPAEAQQTVQLYIKTQKLAHLNYRPVGFINHTAWEPQDLPLLAQNRSSWEQSQLYPFIPASAAQPQRVDIILNNLDDGSHPFHLHGNSFYVLSSFRSDGRDSWGSYNAYTGEEPPNGINLKTPVRKDTVSVPRRGHVVITLLADNPGLWMFHCHMLTHMATGMGMGFHIGDNEDPNHVSGIDIEAAKLCAL